MADWLELQALSAGNRTAEILSLQDVLDITQDAEAEDIGDFDAKGDALVGRVTTEIHDRIKSLGAAYPFAVNEAGTTITLLDGDQEIGKTVYLFCLLMSHVSASPLLESMDLAIEAQSGRELFQICATLAAAGYCEGPGISFGWPRRDRTGFSEKLAQTYALFRDGTPRAVPLPAAPEHIKDGGIDVIAWRTPNDGMPGTIYLLGQVASGGNWKDKSVLNDIRLFHWAWFEVQPASQVLGAMFVPFCVSEVEESVGDGFSPQEKLISKMQFIAKEFGIFLYRYRVPSYAQRCAALIAAGIGPIEGYPQISSVRDWVDAFRGRLNEAAA